VKNIGIDIGKKKCFICVMDEKGSIMEETDYDNTMQDAESFAKNIGVDSCFYSEETKFVN